MSSGSRVTISDIADAVGVHKSTVSLALRNDPRVGPETRERILRAAAELGYVPDAHLSNLMGYLRKISAETSTKHEVIAYLSSESSPETDIHKKPFFRKFRSGAHGELGRLGYRMETFRLADYGFNLKRVETVLRSRNINGMLVSPPVGMDNLEAFNWDAFAAITLGYRLFKPDMHKVISDQMAAMSLALAHIEQSGYKKVVFAYHKGRDLHSGRRWSVSFAGSHRLFPSITDTLIFAGDANGAFVKYFRKCKADALICLSHDFAAKLEDAGLKIPGDLGCILLDADDSPGYFAAIDQQPELLGRLAAQQLAGMLSRHELGLPTLPYILQVTPKWHHGRTCPPR